MSRGNVKFDPGTKTLVSPRLREVLLTAEQEGSSPILPESIKKTDLERLRALGFADLGALRTRTLLTSAGVAAAKTELTWKRVNDSYWTAEIVPGVRISIILPDVAPGRVQPPWSYHGIGATRRLSDPDCRGSVAELCADCERWTREVFAEIVRELWPEHRNLL